MNWRFKLKTNRKKVLLLSSLIIFSIVVVSFLSLSGMFTFQEKEPAINMVSGTEYISGEYGQIIVRVSDRFGNPIQNADCRANVVYPDKTYFLIDRAMQPSSIEGNYYIEFMTPMQVGIYEEIIYCSAVHMGRQLNLTVSSSFHVSLALNFIRELAQNQTNYYNELSGRMSTLEGNLTNINETMIENYDQLDEKITNVDNTLINVNNTLNSKFRKFYDDVVNASSSIFDIFSAN